MHDPHATTDHARSSGRSDERARSYLNGILTVNAVLLAALVWTNVGGGPATANASPFPIQAEDGVPNAPNAAAQRERLINEIKSLRDDVRSLESVFTSGKVKVSVGNVNEFKKMVDDAVARAAAPAPKVDQAPPTVTPSTVAPKP